MSKGVNWGGKRAGAGRKATAGEVRQMHTLRATQNEWDLILRFAKIIKYGNLDAAKKFVNDYSTATFKKLTNS